MSAWLAVMAVPQAAGRFKEMGEEDITRLRGMTLFGIIKQMQHLCGVASMIVSPLGALSPSGFALGRQSSLGRYNHAGNPTEMLHLFNTICTKRCPWGQSFFEGKYLKEKCL